MTVFNSMVIENTILHKMAVNINSNALAKVFKMEFKFFKKKLVIIPMAALLNMIRTTLGCANKFNDEASNVL